MTFPSWPRLRKPNFGASKLTSEQIAKIEKLDIKDGDLLVITADKPVSRIEARKLFRLIEKIKSLISVKFFSIILPPRIDLTLIPKDEKEAFKKRLIRAIDGNGGD